MLNCICEGMKKIKILRLSLLPAVGLCALKNPLLVLEAEDARSPHTSGKGQRYVNGYSGV